ncbi:DUF29 domain-containing protein [Azospirillum griseum]|uniref:DUF29 domain-containing protein n=1 Tax=Azospirillum griseum TaxID=2496639 RepID=A0A431VNY2_9PROT|nr:DUF29 domain-containing protein [Azospirillum griseum]RTR24383.1 DUF29 domain-containing protein [Azospirillum griseum]
MDNRIGYDTDFLAWTEEQARLLRDAARERPNMPIDWDQVAEEIESMGRSEANALTSALTRVIEHLLKLEHSPAQGPRAGWRRSVREHRNQANDALEASPSLRGKLDLAKCHRRGRAFAADGLEQDGITAADLPLDCPYTLDQLLDDEWWPAHRHPSA